MWIIGNRTTREAAERWEEERLRLAREDRAYFARRIWHAT